MTGDIPIHGASNAHPCPTCGHCPTCGRGVPAYPNCTPYPWGWGYVQTAPVPPYPWGTTWISMSGTPPNDVTFCTNGQLAVGASSA